MNQELTAPTIVTHEPGIRKWMPLVILSLALTIIILDTTILNVSLKPIIIDLKADIKGIQWVITAYSLMLAAFTIVGGRFGDFFGRKRMFVMGAIVFAVGSFLTSISTTVPFMIFGEAIIEGIGACLMLPATASLLVTHYQGRDRQIAFGIWGGLAAASAAFGPIVGGWLTTYYSWRWAFRINVIVAALLALGSLLIKESKTEGKVYIDWGGIILSSLGLLSVVFGLIESSTYGWWNIKEPFTLFGKTIGGLGTISVTPFFIFMGIILLEAFFLWELRVMQQGKIPLVSFKLFQNKQFTLAASVTAVLALIQTGVFFAMPVFLQGVKHLDALHTGYALLPMTLSLLVASPFGAYISKFIKPKYLVIAGMILNAVGFFVLRTELDVTASQWALAPGFILFGIGSGFLFSQTSNMALSAVSLREAGEASGVNTTMRQLGATLGSAVLGAILLSSLSTSITNGINASTVIPDSAKPAILQSVSQQSNSIELTGATLNQANIPPQISAEITHITDQATVDGNKEMLLYGIIFIFFGVLLALWLPEMTVHH